MSSNLPTPFHGGGLSPYSEKKVGRELERYEVEAFVATMKEYIDQNASLQCHQGNMLATGQLLDFAVALAAGDPAKQQLYAMSVLNYTTGNLLRINKRFGGVR